ncbi:MAG TPA: hypothetical protein VHB79_18165 [Polyangiaceae bacterium]|nr:hypothetical protein [Polyangiaceae bacterium]
MRQAFRISVLALVLSVGGLAHAQDTGSEPTPAQVRTAAEAFDKGREAYKAEDYVEAAEQFEKADNNAPSPAAIELAIRSRDKAGELDRAATLASLALKRHPDDANLLKLAGELAKRANATLFELTANCDQACDLTVGGKIVHGAPDTARILYLQPGTFTVRAGWPDNRNDSKQVQAEAGGRGELNFVAPTTPAAQSMAKEPEDAPPPPPPAVTEKDEGTGKKGMSPTIVYVGAGLTAVLGGITVWSGLDTMNNPGQDKVKEHCDAKLPDCQSLYDEGHGKQTRTNWLIAGTAVAGAATLALAVFAVDWSGGKSDKPAPAAESGKLFRPRVAVAPWASYDGGGLQAVGRF